MPSHDAFLQQVRYPDPHVPLTAYWARGKLGMTAERFAYHPDMEIHFLARGAVMYIVGDKRYRLRPRSLLVIHPHERHTFRQSSSETSMERITFVLNPKFAGLPPHGLASRRREHRHAVLSVDEAADLIGIARTIQSELKTRRLEWATLCRIKARELAVLCQRALLHDIPADASNPRIERVVAFIDDHLHQAIDNRQLATVAELSASRLMHVFKDDMGLTLKQYISIQRVTKACELLVGHADWKVGAIARKTGFNHFADFNRVFKRYTGITAAAYRAEQALPHRD